MTRSELERLCNKETAAMTVDASALPKGFPTEPLAGLMGVYRMAFVKGAKAAARIFAEVNPDYRTGMRDAFALVASEAGGVTIELEGAMQLAGFTSNDDLLEVMRRSRPAEEDPEDNEDVECE